LSDHRAQLEFETGCFTEMKWETRDRNLKCFFLFRSRAGTVVFCFLDQGAEKRNPSSLITSINLLNVVGGVKEILLRIVSWRTKYKFEDGIGFFIT